MPGLDNYLALVTRVDQLCAQTASRFESHISCRRGCDACCRHLSVFAVEAAAITEALAALPEADAEVIRGKAEAAAADAPCPLLDNGSCLLYEARPIICRTHGLPLLLSRDGERSVDFCPENFQGVTSIPGSAVLDLDRLNEMLAAINALYLQSFPGAERVMVAEVLKKTR